MPQPDKPTVASYCTTFLKPEMRHIYRQVTGLKRYHTFVITKERKCREEFPFPDVEVLKPANKNFIRRFHLKHIRKLPALYYRGESQVMARALERRHTDLMHIYFGHTGVHLLPFVRNWGMPTVVSFHGMDIQTRPEKPGYDDRMRELLQEIPIVLARSHSLLDRLKALGCPDEKLRLNRTGIPLEYYPEMQRALPENGAWHFVQACRLIAKKGLNTALTAFAAFHKEYPNARFSIAGEGPLLPDLERAVRELGIADAVSFRGFLSQGDLADLYAGAHVFVHPSEITADQNQEGVPNSMLEAMATGLPVLATVHGGIPEAVTHDRTGLLVQERDAEALHHAMKRMTSEPEFWRSSGAAAAASVREDFSQQRSIEKLESFYDEARAVGGRKRATVVAATQPTTSEPYVNPWGLEPNAGIPFAYLFERFPSFVQTFCYREAAEMVGQQMRPLIISLREPEEPRPAEFPADIEVRWLPDADKLGDTAKEERKAGHLPQEMLETLRVQKVDRNRIYEAFHLGPILQSGGITHVHAHFAGIAARTAYWLKRFYGIRYSVTGHANDIFCPEDFPVTLRDIITEAELVVTETDYARKWLCEQYPEARGKTHRVFNGISMAGFLPRESPLPSPPRILSVGRYVEKKGFRDLIAACALLRDQGLAFDCSIVGDGPLEPELRAQIEAAGLQDCVHLLGPRPQEEVRRLLAGATVFVLACVTESDGGSDNLPTVIMEAMAASVPSISTRLAGVTEMITHEADGLLVASGDVTALAAEIRRVLDEPALAQRLGTAGRATAEQRFAVEQTTRELKHLLVKKAGVFAPPEARSLDRKLPAKHLRRIARKVADAAGKARRKKRDRRS